ncbi:MAG: metal dependent phosphohydrolase [Bacillota bacterium]|nr:metal dependent phosphohydrolase [Bacillota bacterium]
MLTKETLYQRVETSNALPEEDSELSNLLLRHLNSNIFLLYRNISDIKEAVTYLGIESIRNLLIFFIAQKFFQAADTEKATVFHMRQYWKHVLATSIATDMICSRLGIEDRYRMFSYGLNHDIGILVMNACLPKELDEITSKVKSGIPQIVAEKTVLGGVTHSHIGAWICQRWNFSPEITRVVELHHTPYLGTVDLKTLEIMYLADLIGTQYYERLLNVNSSMQVNHKVLGSLGLTLDDQKEIGIALPNEVARIAKYFIL